MKRHAWLNIGSPLTWNCCREPSALTRLSTKSRNGCRLAILRLEDGPLGVVPPGRCLVARSLREGVHPDAQHFEDRTGHLGEVPRLVLLPVPVGGELGEAAIPRLAFAQFRRPLPHRLFQRLVVVLELSVQQPDFEHVVDARLDLEQVERLADEILGARLQRPQLVSRLGGQHDDRKVAIRIVGLEGFHHLEAIHARHLQVEQDQVVAVPAVESADLLRILRRGDAGVARLAKQLFEQTDIGLLIVDDQDAGVENRGCTVHHGVPSRLALADRAPASFSAVSSVDMNSLTLMGLVR